MTESATYDGRTSVDPALSWSAIFAGSLVAVATSVFLTVLASGFGYELAAVALGSQRSLDAFTPSLGAAGIAIQVISAGLGGYLAGRLRHPWNFVHHDEAHFRDTAHGLIVWALSAIASLILFVVVIAPLTLEQSPVAPSMAADPDRAAHIFAQAAFFAAVGMLLSAFIAAVAARIGGLQFEHMGQKGLAHFRQGRSLDERHVTP
ncbi:MAG TPA: hypothetical protein VGF71_10880 [Caulobacteraceae bacterium]|jgi:hypothetical protein